MLRIETLDFESTEIENYNEAQAKIQNALDALPDLQAELVIAAGIDPVAKLRSQSEKLAARPFELQREAVALAEKDGAACHAVLGKLAESALDAAEFVRSKACDSAEKTLRKGGFAPESDPGFAANPTAAEARFAHALRRSQPVRDAQLLADQARENQIALKKNAVLWCDDLQHAKSELRTMVRQLLGF
ncbi:MAG: hypothetical protein NTX48_08060 [Planctomycetales bacterium]|nr:hypothetical protein [Planctomycetales bacterium]